MPDRRGQRILPRGSQKGEGAPTFRAAVVQCQFAASALPRTFSPRRVTLALWRARNRLWHLLLHGPSRSVPVQRLLLPDRRERNHQPRAISSASLASARPTAIRAAETEGLSKRAAISSLEKSSSQRATISSRSCGFSRWREASY